MIPYKFCNVCLNLFRAADRRSRLCSRECVNIFHGNGRALPECQCQLCGKSYKPRSRAYQTFCSRSCAFAKRKESADKKLLDPPKIKTCFVCREPMPSSQHAFCSEVCRLREYKDRRITEWKIKRVIEIESRATIQCPVCKKTFSPKHLKRKFCSVRCLNKHQKSQRIQIGPGLYRRKMARILLRDKRICQLCYRPVKFMPMHPLSPSLDHIVPVSMGGSNDDSNLQLAHLRCNILKSDSVQGQLRIC